MLGDFEMLTEVDVTERGTTLNAPAPPTMSTIGSDNGRSRRNCGNHAARRTTTPTTTAVRV